MMYGAKNGPAIHESINVWIQLEFTNEASFHGVLAYSAAHLSRIRGLPVPPLAIMHNMKAIQVINNLLEDPSMMTSDAAIAGVLRLVSMEVSSLSSITFLF
jgi:hypothetical protein